MLVTTALQGVLNSEPGIAFMTQARVLSAVQVSDGHAFMRATAAILRLNSKFSEPAKVPNG